MLNIHRKIYDIIGIGVGPFNLGLAAMLDGLPQLNCLFFDQAKEFNWHAGMLLPNARLQVPFYADLITVIDPCSRFTYLNYLKENQRLFRFAIHENNFITRKEYNNYCRWVISELDTVCLHHKVVDVHYEEKDEQYTVMVHNLSSDKISFYYAKHLVIGIGNIPHLPECIRSSFDSGDLSHCHAKEGTVVIHSSDYLFQKDSLLEQSNITIVGSGQSAAEIFYDLLQYSDHLDSLHWFTRSERFYPMEYSKLSLELTSPDYIDHFYSLDSRKKKEVLRKQSPLYKGINYSLINEIYDALYLKSLDSNSNKVCLHPNTELKQVNLSNQKIVIQFDHLECETCFDHRTNALILATGYKNCIPDFLSSIKEYIQWRENGIYQVGRNYAIDISGKQIFIQNGELHTHGFSAPDLGMGPYRNATIVNAILGYEHFVMESKISFQHFGIID